MSLTFGYLYVHVVFIVNLLDVTGSYITYWTDTPVQTVLQEKLRNVTVGGTSAGLAILGQFVYSSLYSSAVSADCLANPYTSEISLAYNFLTIPFLDTVLTDTHFVTRDRMGRMLTFLARVLADNHLSPDPMHAWVRGVGIDEQTYLLLNVSTGMARIGGKGTGYVCTPTVAPTVIAVQTVRQRVVRVIYMLRRPVLELGRCARVQLAARLNQLMTDSVLVGPMEWYVRMCACAQPLSFPAIDCMRLESQHADWYDFSRHVGSGVPYRQSIEAGQFTAPAYGPARTSA